MRMYPRMAKALLTGALLLLVQSQAQAQPAGHETAELRSLRLAEEALFLRAQPMVSGAHHAAPSVFSSRVAAPQRQATGNQDLSWLRGLNLPSLPIRWDDRVIRFLSHFRSHQRGRILMAAWLRRAPRFRQMIEPVLREEGLPADLLWVAMAESGFNPTARSNAGAVGLWQFTGATGEEFGLGQDNWVDLRMDPERSTRAAARYLGQLYQRFGSWELALAAYNMGYGALLRSIRKFNTNDYWTLANIEAGLPFETTIYVAKILACALIARNPARFGFGDLTTEPTLTFERVQVPPATTLRAVARAARVSLEDLQRLNPELMRNRVPPDRGDWTVRIPTDSAERFRTAWARRQQGRTPRVHRVRFGESLEQIARAFRITPAQLRELNELDAETPIGVGMALIVPANPPRPTEAEAEAEAEAGAEEEQPVIAVPSGPSEYPGRTRVFYRVAPDDLPEEIAEFFSITVDELRRWNNLDAEAALQRGMFLQLFVPTGVDLAQALVLTESDVRVLTVGSDAFFDYHEAQRGRVRIRYRIQEGDTLTSIGERFGLSVGSLMRINRVARNAVLRVGQEIIVYAPQQQVAASTDGEQAQPQVASAR